MRWLRRESRSSIDWRWCTQPIDRVPATTERPQQTLPFHRVTTGQIRQCVGRLKRFPLCSGIGINCCGDPRRTVHCMGAGSVKLRIAAATLTIAKFTQAILMIAEIV